MSTDFAVPGMSFGIYSPLGDVESRGIRVEPFTVRAAVNAGVGFDDNVTLSQTNKRSSMFFTLNPSVAVGLEGALQRYYAIYRGNYGWYPSQSAANYDDHTIALTAANDWTTRFRSFVAYEFTRGHTPPGLVGSSIGTPVEWNSNLIRGTASYGAEGAQGRLEATTSYRTWRYVTDRATNAGGDYDRFDLGGTVSHRLGPKTRTLAQINYADITHPSNRALDNTEMVYAVGATWDALATTQGTVRAGMMTKSFSDSTFSDFSGASFEGSVRWAPRTYSIVELSARRFLSETFVPGASLLVNTYAGATWNHDWYGGYRSTVRYAYGRSVFEGIDRTDSYHDGGVRVSYGISRALRVGAELRHDRRNSDAGALTYRRNIILFSLETAI